MLSLRVWNPSGEPIQQRERPDEDFGSQGTGRLAALAALAPANGASRSLRRRSRVCHGASAESHQPNTADTAGKGSGERPTPRPAPRGAVGPNPILWREVATRAYGQRPLLVKTAYFVVLALICYFALAPLWGGARFPFAAAYGLAPVGVLSLLLVAAQAATSITSERDAGALDLLLVTDLTPKEFIFGKLCGVLWNTKEYVIPPLILAMVYACWGLLAAAPAGHKEMAASMNAMALICVVVGLLMLMAFVMVLGLHVALADARTAGRRWCLRWARSFSCRWGRCSAWL